MGTEDFISLINPAMSLVFSAAFLLLWHHQKQRRYVWVLGLAYLTLAVAFLIDYFAPPELIGSKLVSNMLLVAAAVGLAAGAIGRYEKRLAFKAIFVTAVIGFAAFSWFLVVTDSLTWRIYAMNFTFGAMALLLALELRDVPQRKPIDDFLIGSICLWGVSYIVRPLVVIWLDGPYVDYEGFNRSLYWITLNFSTSLFLLLFAMTMVAGIAFDVMDELKRESQTDPLSELLNRRGFEEGAEALLRSAHQKRMPAALIVCDLDHFKSVNDRYGHALGDVVIATFADCLRRSIDARHIAGRIGGEEFAILLPGANLSTARLFAEGIRTSFGALAVPGLPGDLRLSASFGVAEQQAGEVVSGLFSRADIALYEAKKAGRNRVRVVATSAGRPASAIDRPVEFAPGI